MIDSLLQGNDTHTLIIIPEASQLINYNRELTSKWGRNKTVRVIPVETGIQ